MYSSREITYTNSAFMSRVYLWMMIGLVLSGVVAYQVAATPNVMAYLFANKWIWIGLIVAQLAAVVMLSALINKMI